MDVDVKLPGVNPVPKTLASGKEVTYYYAWKSGPRLTGEYGSPEFVASYYEAHKGRSAEPPKKLRDLLDQYASSKHFDKKLKSTSQSANLGIIRRIKRNVIAELTVASLSDHRTGEILETWRDTIAEKTPGEARNQWSTLAAALSWAVDQRLIKSNPCLGIEVLPSGSRVDKIWSEEQIAKFCDEAPSYLVIAFMIALWTGQREGSLIKLRWSAYDGQCLWVEQDKNKRNTTPKIVAIPVIGAFKKFLDRLELQAGVVGLSKEERHEHHIILTSRGRPWANPGSFATKFSETVAEIVEDRTFHDLRGTAITRLARSGCTVPQIATITGHSLKTVQIILDKHYLHRDIVLAKQAMENLDKYESSQPTYQLLESV